jgi:hypothetical protein
MFATEKSKLILRPTNHREFFRRVATLLDFGDGIECPTVVYRLWLALVVHELPADGDVLVPGSR